MKNLSINDGQYHNNPYSPTDAMDTTNSYCDLTYKNLSRSYGHICKHTHNSIQIARLKASPTMGCQQQQILLSQLWLLFSLFLLWRDNDFRQNLFCHHRFFHQIRICLFPMMQRVFRFRICLCPLKRLLCLTQICRCQRKMIFLILLSQHLLPTFQMMLSLYCLSFSSISQQMFSPWRILLWSYKVPFPVPLPPLPDLRDITWHCS